jgi:hypothetical protein
VTAITKIMFCGGARRAERPEANGPRTQFIYLSRQGQLERPRAIVESRTFLASEAAPTRIESREVSPGTFARRETLDSARERRASLTPRSAP